MKTINTLFGLFYAALIIAAIFVCMAKTGEALKAKNESRLKFEQAHAELLSKRAALYNKVSQ